MKLKAAAELASSEPVGGGEK